MSKCKITGKVLVIHLGREETRIVRMSGSEIQHRAAFVTPKGAVEDGMIRNPEAVRELLKAALKTREFRGIRQAVFVLNTSQVITATATTPELSEAKLEKLLQANMDMYFPVDIQEYHVVWQVISPKVAENGTKELTVQLWAVPDAVTQRYYSVANACGLSVAAIDYCGNSIATAVGAGFSVKAKAKAKKKLDMNMELSFGKKKKTEQQPASVAVEDRIAPETDLHITLEKELLGMTFVQEGRVVLQRFVRNGGDPTYQFSELAMILEYFRSLESGRGSEIRGILSGDYAGDAGICRELSDMLGIPLQVLSGDIAPQMVLFVGAAHTTVDFGTPALNRPGKVRRELQSQLWQYGLVLVCGVVLVGVILLSLSSQLVWNAEIRGLESNLQTVSIQAQKSAGFADNYKKYAANYDSYSADWDTVYSSLQTYNDNLVLMLQEMEEILPENTSVTALQFASDGMSVQFACETKEEAAFLIMALRQLKYADLAAISNLGGGGGGAAESYGPDEETPPTEGSFDPETDGLVIVTFNLTSREADENSAVKDLIASELTEDEVMGLVSGLTTEQLTLMEKAYGKAPDTNYETLADLKLNARPTPTFTNRKNALAAMFNSDPFVANRFVDLLMEDFYRSESILMKYILWDIMDLEQSGELNFNLNDPASMRESIDTLIGILTKDEETLAATEALLCTEAKIEGKKASVSELTYVHYLEVQLKLREEDRFPFLDMDAIFTDLLEGGFDTGDKALDAKLNAMISDKTWNLLKSFSSQEKVAKMVKDYLTNGTTGEPVADELIAVYLTTGTTGNKTLDGKINDYIAGDEMGKLTAELMEKYLTTGTTGNELLNGMFESYFNKGTSGNTHLDSQLKKSLSGSDMKALMAELLSEYLSKNTTGNSALDQKLGKYLDSGSSGSSALDALITECISSGGLDSLLEELIGKYLETGTSGSTVLNLMIAKYESEGTCNNLYFDRIFSKLIPSTEDPFDGRTEEEMAELFGQYLSTGATDDAGLNKKLNAFFSQGTSGNNAMDNAIGRYLSSAQGERQVTNMVDRYLASGTTSSKVLDTLVGNYFANDTSGNTVIDGIIEKHIEGGSADAQLEKLIGKYVADGTTGIGTLDKKLSRFTAEGTTGSTKLDSLLRSMMPEVEEDPFAGLSGSQITEMLDKYFATGTTGNGAADVMLDKYFATGTTGNPAVDTILKSYIATSESGDYLSKLLAKYFATGTTGRAALDKAIDSYILTGTTGNTVLDIAVTGTLGTSLVVKNSIITMLDNYLAVGTTGNQAMDKLIENYLLKGTTGNKNLDKVIDDYLEEQSTSLENKFNEMFADYLANGTTGYIVFDRLIDKYFENGTTGNRFMDVVLEEYYKEKLSELFMNYLNEGTSGIPAFDKMLENYLMRGTTGNPGFDRMIAQYMKSDTVKEMLIDLAKKYTENGTTGNNKLDALFFLYLMRGTTGNKELDELIESLELFPGKGPSKPSDPSNPSKPGGDNWEDIWENLFGGGGSTGGGGTTGPVDTRITFTAVLLYNEELINEELVRKGLDYNGKIDKVEVEGR